MVTKNNRRNHLWFAFGLLVFLLSFGLTVGNIVGAAAARPILPLLSPLLTPTRTFTITPTPAPSCGLFWRGVNSPNASNANSLGAIAAVSANDIWAVGEDWSSGTNRGFTMHWDDTQWNIVPSPNTGELNAVTAVSSNDVWAVGVTGVHPNLQTVTMHWDGSQWSIVPSPNIGALDNILYGVTALASNDAWAVGYYYNTSAGQYQTLTMHWRGASWTVVSSPNITGTGENRLNAVSASSANDVWAVGTYQGGTQMVILHWDGTQWNVVPGLGGGALYGVVALSANDAWAVGSVGGQLAMHWDGAQWSAVSSPPVPGGQGFSAVSATSSNDVWAVGNTYDSIAEHTLIEHWDGAMWSISPSLSLGTQINFLYGVAAISANEAWTVGYYANGGSPSPSLTQILRYNDPCASPTSTYTPTNSPTPTQTPTFTQTPGATNTPANTPCSILTPFAEGFESGALNSFTSQVAQCGGIGCGWRVVTNSIHSGIYSAFGPNVSSTSDQRLVLNTPVAIPTGASAATLTFWHKHHFDTDAGLYYDGSVLEFSTNSGASWTDVLSTTNFISGGYVGPIVYGHYNPLARRQAWGGFNASYPDFDQVVVNLMPFAGQNLLFRFRIGTDHVVGAEGWWIDDIQVNIASGACATNTPTYTATPTPVLVGHVTWQGPPAQPNGRQQLPITLTLKLGAIEVNYPTQNTDASGFFTVPIGSLPTGTYNWRVKGPRYLARTGTVSLGVRTLERWNVGTFGANNVPTFQRSNVLTSQVEMGLMRVGDANDDNIISTTDFNILKGTFGKGLGDPGYDARADFSNDDAVNIADVNLLKINFGQSGAPPLLPRQSYLSGD